MGDMGDYFRDTKDFRREQSKKKKSNNLKSSLQMLINNGIKFEEKSDCHVVVSHNGLKADFWPTTGKFNIRGRSEYQRGVRLLIKLLLKG